MNTTFVNHGRKALAVKVAIAALLAACIAMIVGGSQAKAASGDPFNASFNYAGLNVDVTLAQLDELVLDGTGDSLDFTGTYTDNSGNFTLPEATGLSFPDIALDLGSGVNLNASIGLDGNATGNYNSSTGAMSLEAPINLTIGVSDVSALPIPGLGSGPLTCKFAPINLSLSTSKGWPHAGSAFANPATIENGALAGAWRSKPAAVALDGPQATCDLIAGVLKDVGGLWLANSTSPISSMPAATESKPTKANCEELGKTGTFPNCVDPVCPEGQEGTPPNDCHPIVVPAANFSKIAVTPAKGTIKKGKKGKLTVKVTNSGTASGTATVTVKSSNSKVTTAKSFKVTVGAGKTVSKSITLSASKKAKGKATITVKVGSKSATSTLTVK